MHFDNGAAFSTFLVVPQFAYLKLKAFFFKKVMFINVDVDVSFSNA